MRLRQVTPALFAAAALLIAGCLAPASEELAASAVPSTTWDSMAVAAHGGALATPPALEEVLNGAPVPTTFLSSVGMEGAEPTMGITSNGWLFFVAMEKTLRSKDGGKSWEEVSITVDAKHPVTGNTYSAPPTLDPMLWVDPVTDRVFVDHLTLACSVLSFSDDYGETWITNPVACGVPVNDHQKITTGKNVGSRPQAPTYPNVVYYAYNGLALGARVSASFDGGLTFTQNAQATPPTCVGGLHGSLTVAPDGTLYLPKRDCDGPMVGVSKDSGATWKQVKVGEDVGTTLCQKNPEIGVDNANNAYLTWAAEDDKLYLSRSTDGGSTWDETSILATPDFINTATFPVIMGGDPGRIAIAYYGTDAVPETKEGRDGEDKRGPDTVPEDARWHLWITYSLNALDANPTFVTVRATPADDPIQIGPISTNSSGCPNPAGSRNLLDFIDMVVDEHGRVFVAYADGCVDECVDKGASATMKDSRSRIGYVAVVSEGPSLIGSEALKAYDGPEDHHT